MKNMFLDKAVLNTFKFSSENNVTDCESAFENSGIVSFETTDLNACTIYTNMFKDTASLDTVKGMNTLIGIQFEGMFLNSTVTCIDELDTCLGEFPPNYITCSASSLSCSATTVWQCGEQITDIVCPTSGDMIDCTAMLDACIYLDCDEFLDIFSTSTMFSNALGLVSPDTEQQNKIINRFHYIGVESC